MSSPKNENNKTHHTELLERLAEKAWKKCLVAPQPSNMDSVNVNFAPQG